MAKNKHRQTDLEPKGHTEASKFLWQTHEHTHTKTHLLSCRKVHLENAVSPSCFEM